MMSEFKSETASQLKSSGTEEEHSEREQLLQDITERIAEEKDRQVKLKIDKVATEYRAAVIRERAMTNIVPKAEKAGETTSPVAGTNKQKRTRDVSLMDLMKDEVKLKRHQLQLDEEKWKVDKAEKLAFLELLKKQKRLRVC